MILQSLSLWKQYGQTFLFRGGCNTGGMKNVFPDLPLSHQLALQYAEASWDEEEVVPATDVGMGARPPLQRRSVQVAPSQWQGGKPGVDTIMMTGVHQIISII